MYIINTAAEEDMLRILEIEHETISPPWTHGALLGEIFRDDSFFAVAVVDGGVIGFVILRRITDEGELLQIAVDPSARRRGVADMLMCAALDYASKHSLGSVFLEVRSSNLAAISLYEKHGFKRVRVRKDYYSDPVEDAVVMVRTVNASISHFSG